MAPNLNDLKYKILAQKASISELAEGAKSDTYLFFNALMDNNLNDVNVTLRRDLGYSKVLPFEANRKKIEGIIDSFIQSNDKEKLQVIIDKFDYNPTANNYTTHPGFVASVFNKNINPGGRIDFIQSMTEIGTGVGSFVNPVINSLGSSTTTTTVKENKTSTGTIAVIVVVVLAVIGVTIFLFSPKAPKIIS